MPTIKQSDNLAEFEKIARQLAQSFRGGQTIGVTGELGAGKTTFVQFVAAELGVKKKVNSPTFVLMKVYRLPANRLSVARLSGRQGKAGPGKVGP